MSKDKWERDVAVQDAAWAAVDAAWDAYAYAATSANYDAYFAALKQAREGEMNSKETTKDEET